RVEPHWWWSRPENNARVRSRHVMDIDDTMRRGVNPVGLEQPVASGTEPVALVRRQDERHAGLQDHRTIAAFEPRLALTLEHGDGLHVVGVKWGLIARRRSLDTNADGCRALSIAHQGLVGGAAFERLGRHVAVVHDRHDLALLVLALAS